MKIMVQFPTRGRPEQFLDTLRQWQSPEVFNIHVVIDKDDPTMNNWVMRRELAKLGVPDVSLIDPAGKIAAINYGVRDRDWDICVVAQDDLLPLGHYGRTITDLFQRHAPSTDMVLHPDDGHGSGDLNTLLIVGRAYYRRFWYLYHPQYKSLWADNEFTDVSTHLYRSLRTKQVLMVHQWVGDTNPGDGVLAGNEKHYGADRATYLRRKAAGFPTQRVP